MGAETCKEITAINCNKYMTLKLGINRKTSGERGSYMRTHYTITLLRNIQFYKPKTALKTLINLQK